MAWTNKQREWLRERDGGKCQFPVAFYEKSTGKIKWRTCGNTGKVEVHHIRPNRMTEWWWGWTREDQNVPTNGITLCLLHHRMVHPDVQLVYDKGASPEAFEKMFTAREDLLRKGLPYHQTTWDILFLRIADKRTQKFIRKYGKKFPYKKDKKKEKKENKK